MASLRTFDAFPKTESQHVRRSTKGGLSSALLYICLLFIAWLEFGSYFGGYIDEQYIVDNEIGRTAQVNINIVVKTPCRYLHVIAIDESYDVHHIKEGLALVDVPFIFPADTNFEGFHDIVTPELDEIISEAVPAQFKEAANDPFYQFDGETQGFEGCSIYGSVPVNKIKGEIRIIPKELLLISHVHNPRKALNFSHVIHELSFGDFFPYIDNPLDGVGRLAEEPFMAYHYFTSVVPTRYEKLGAIVDTNQYSVSGIERNVDLIQRPPPGIVIRYDFEGLKIVIKDERIGFWQFIVRLIAIISFILYMATIFFRLVDWILVYTLGPKWSLRYQNEKLSHGLLDDEK